ADTCIQGYSHELAQASRKSAIHVSRSFRSEWLSRKGKRLFYLTFNPAAALRCASQLSNSGQSACSSVPTCHSIGVARRPGQIRRLRRDRSHAQPPLGASMARTHNLTGLSTTPCLRLRRGGLVVVTLTAASSLAGKALRIEDGELVHRLLPMVRCLSPIGGDIAQSQPDQLARRVVTGE